MRYLRTCRLPFNICHQVQKKLDKHSPKPLISLPNLSNINHLRRLIIGMHTSRFLERLLSCIPFIESLSIGVEDPWINVNDSFDMNSLPAAVDGHLLSYLSLLRIDCANNISFHRIIALLSSVFGQLSHLSLKLEVCTLNSGPLSISGDIIQQSCIDLLKPSATYSLNLFLYVQYDLGEKIIFNSFLKCPFTNRQQPRVFIQERDNFDIGYGYHCFMIYTLPYNDTKLSTYLFSTDLEKSCQMSINAVDLFPYANELLLCGYKNRSSLPQLVNCRSSISSLVPWSLLTKISIDDGNVVHAAKLETILRLAYNVRTLEINDDSAILPRAILRNYDNLGTRVNQQIQSLYMDDMALTLQNAQRFF